MPRPFVSPNLPDTAVRQVLVAESFVSQLAAPLAALSIEALPAPKTLSLPYRVNDHADMNCRPIGGKEYVVFQDAILPPEIHATGLHAVRSSIKGSDRYPGDAALNVLLISGFAFHKPGITEPHLKELLDARGYIWVSVPQGYTACSTAVVDANSLITADEKIAVAATETGFDVLKIQTGYIDLPGYAYGFLGGSCGKISPSKLAFTGHLNGHPDHDAILTFLTDRGIEPVFLTDRPCFDCGGILPVTQL